MIQMIAYILYKGTRRRSKLSSSTSTSRI